MGALRRTYATTIASACSLPNADSVWNLLGHNGTTSITTGSAVEAFIEVPQGFTANEMARRLYAASFKEQFVRSTQETLGAGAEMPVVVGTVTLELEKFHPPTTTVATTTLTTTTVTTDSSTTSTATTSTLTSTTAGTLVQTAFLTTTPSGSRRTKAVISFCIALFVGAGALSDGSE